MNIRAAFRSFVDTLRGRFIKRSIFDTRRYFTSTITPDRVATALNTLSGTGWMRDIADIYDAMPATDSHVLGVRRQLRAGVQGIDMEPVAVSDDSIAEQMAEACKTAMERPGASWSALTNGILEGYLRGASLTEVMWEDPPVASPRTAGPKPLRYWKEFKLVPQQRLRYDYDTGELLLLVPDAIGRLANLVPKPMGAFPPGKFIRCQVDEDLPDFSLRGTYRSVLKEWLARGNVAEWELYAIERYGMPIPIGKYATETGRQNLDAMMKNFGAAGMLLVDENSSVEWGLNTTKDSVHETFLEKSAERISIAFLGATQTVTIAQDSGSKASVGEHQAVRRDILYAIAELIAETVRRDLFIPFVRENFGESYVKFTPRLVPQFDEPVDLLTSAQAWAVLKNELGYVAPLDDVNEITGITFEQGTPTPIQRSLTGPTMPGTFPRAVPPAAPTAPGLLVDKQTQEPSVDVQTLALNGAQVAALQAIVQSVADGSVPAESAIVILQVAFPTIGADVARAIISPVKPESIAPVAPFPAQKTAIAAASRVKVPMPETPAAFGRDVAAPLKRLVDSTAVEDLAKRIKQTPAPNFDKSADLLAAEMLEQHMKAITETRNARGSA